MKKNYTTTSRLVQYAASATAFLSIQQADATVVYTDLDPDITLGGEGAESVLDINEDGTDDFSFSIYSFSGSGTYLGLTFTYGVKAVVGAALNGNEFVGSLVTYSGYSGVYTPVLADDVAIYDGLEFAEGSASLGFNVVVSLLGAPYYSYSGGVWLGTDMAFLGFRLNIDKDRYYGWMRISVSEDASTIIIHDYAYESTANQAIFTGQVATDITTTSVMDADVFASGNTINIQVSADESETTGSMFDLNGKLVKSFGQLTGTSTFTCSDLATGNYIVRLESPTGVYRKQIHLTN
ncbi:MAG TPA: T9SS type A sorting domain-containing protein [Chitinophagales bacterium]|jgi:hypothetical protein|nr:T9SS type A sorting domain-containing protein [Chitinophagales bacterium]